MASGLPGDSFTFLGFPPSRGKDRKQWFERLRGLSGIVVFYEAPHRILTTLQDLSTVIGNRTIVIGRELTKKHEELVRGPIFDVVSHLQKPQGELTVVVDIGQSTNIGPTNVGQMTDQIIKSRRAVIAALAKSLGLATNDVYDALAPLFNR